MTMAERAPHGPLAPDEHPEHLRWNCAVIALTSVVYMFALALVEPNTVMPVLVSRLTRSPIAVGALGAIGTAGWLLPQLLAARHLSHRERKKGFMVWACLVTRFPLLALLAALMLAPSRPALVLAVLFLAFAIFELGEGAGDVAWTDIVAKAIPDRLRGRLFAFSDILGGLAAAGAGIIVKRVLENPAIAYPRNYALLVSLMFALMMVAVVVLAAMREPIRPVMEEETRFAQLVRQIPEMLRRRPALVRLLALQYVLAASMMAAPFYVVYATRHLSVPEGMVGTFVSVQMLAGMAGGLVVGYLNDHVGTTSAIRLGAVAAVAIPLVALVVPALSAGPLAGLWLWCYSLVFVFMGVVFRAWIAHMNFLLESVSHRERAAYIGVMNTLAAAECAFPLLGGWIAGAGSYPALFAVSLVCAVAAVALSLALKDPRAQSAGEIARP